MEKLFRFWDDYEKQFVYFDLYELAEESFDLGYYGEAQQCIGLIDKNGNRIYVGDIVKDVNNAIGVIEDDAFEFLVNDNVIISCYGIHINYTQGCMFPLLTNPGFYEIVGSVYETPKLLG